MELIAFACQRCRQPLSLPTLSDIDDMAKFIPATETQSKQPFDCNVEIADSSRPSRQTPVVRKHIHPCVDSTGIVSEDKSYVIVSQDDKQHTVNVPKDKEFVSRVQRASKLFDAISSGGTYDHPLCQECGDYFCDTLESQISELKTEKELYEEILLQSQEDSSNSITSGELDELNAEISTLSLEESKLIGKVKEMQKKREDLERELHELEVECRQLAEEEDSFYSMCNQEESQLMAQTEVLNSQNNLLAHANAHLERLKRTNIHNDAFHIWHDGPFGTINGLRLGRLPGHPVEWMEINAAWGQAALLLKILADTIQLDFQIYRIIPMGSFSRVEKYVDDRAVYELYGSGELQISRLFWNRRFDQAQVAFLNCIQQLSDYAQQKDATFRLPYRVNKDKIGEVSIKNQFGQDELWTKALKYMLTNLKWLLAFCCGSRSLE